MTARRIAASIAALALAALALAAVRSLTEPQPADLARSMPPGAMLFLESPNFQSLLSDWMYSQQKQAWLGSENYQVFSRSRLFERLQSAQAEFAGAAGLPADTQLLTQVTGTQSAFAWYDIGKLEFLYITRLPSSSLSQSALWQSRSSFDRRQSAGIDFYERSDPQSQRTVAFAALDDWLILGTREDLVAGALTRLHPGKDNPPGGSIADEPWYADAVSAAKTAGDLRMVLNLEKIVPSPYFRSYWVQDNITEMQQYRSAICDLYRSSEAFREERVLLRREGAAEVQPPEDISALAAAAPPDAGFYRAVAQPGSADALELLRDKLLQPGQRDASSADVDAPTVNATPPQAGQASDLETRIDQPAAVTDTADPWAPLGSQLESAQIKGVLQVESSAPGQDSVFTRYHSAVVLVAAQNWNAEQLQSTIASALGAQLSTSQAGVSWTRKGGYVQLDGLLPLLLSVEGRTLILSNDAPTLLAVQARLHRKAEKTAPAVYAANFRHAQEAPVFQRVTTLIDRAAMHGNSGDPNAEAGSGQAPAFFSGNIAGLSRVFSAVQSESIVTHDEGKLVTQTVTYQWK